MPETCISVDCASTSLTNHYRRNLGILRAHRTHYECSVWQCSAVHVRCGRSLGRPQDFILYSVFNMYHYKMHVLVAKMEQIIPSNSTQRKLTQSDSRQSDSTQSDLIQNNSTQSTSTHSPLYKKVSAACPRHSCPNITSSCYRIWIPLSLSGTHQESWQTSIIDHATSPAWASLTRQGEDVTTQLHTRTKSKLPDWWPKCLDWISHREISPTFFGN